MDGGAATERNFHIAFDDIGAGPVDHEGGARQQGREATCRHRLCERAGTATIERRPLTMRLIAVLGSALFLVIAPGTILGLGPWWITRWRFESPAWEALPLRVVGAVLILAGVPILLESFARFALEGLGTPAPVAPPRHLVVTGVYRHVRNPIYVALTSIIVGQALLFGNVVLFGYAAIWVFVFNLAVLVHEEPELRATFGAEYEAYCANVPRWLPRLRGWQGSWKA